MEKPALIIIDTLTPHRLATEIGMPERTIRHARTTGRFSGLWFGPVADLCHQLSIPCPIDAFTWKAVAKKDGASCEKSKVSYGGSAKSFAHDGKLGGRGVTQCALYRIKNAAGETIYVGKARNPLSRLAAHAAQPWAGEVASISVEWLPTEEDALTAEADAIRQDAPKHNDIHKPRTFDGPCNRGASQITPAGWAALAAEGLTMKEAAARAGKSYAAARKAASAHGIQFRLERKTHA